MIAASPEAMKMVWLNVGDRFHEPRKEDLQAFRASVRKYQNFKMSEIENGLQIVLCPKREWKRAKIDIQSFTSFSDYKYLLNIFNESIQDLEVFDMTVERSSGEHNAETLEFKQLKRLRIGFLTSPALKPFLRTIPRLEILIIENITDIEAQRNENSQELIVQFVQLQPQITHLSLSSDAFCKLFEQNSCCELQLKYLLVEYSGKVDESPELIKNFEVFIKKQKYLNWITLCDWTCTKSLAKIMSLMCIERLSFDYFDGDSEKFEASTTVKLGKNQNIRKIDFEGENFELIWLKFVLEAAENVEDLYFFHVTEEVLKYLLLNCKHLKLLKYCSIFPDFSKFYENLTTEFGGKVNEKVEIIEEKFLELKNII